MADDFDRILRSGAEEHAAHMTPATAASVRARGERLRRRRRGATVAATAVAVAGIGGGVLVALGPPQHDAPPSAAITGSSASPSRSGTGGPLPVPTDPSSPSTGPVSRTPGPGPSSSRTPGPGTSSSGAGHASPPAAPGCTSLVVPQGEKDAVTEAYRRAEPGLVHIAPVKGLFYYGACDGSFYAGARFTPTPGATLDEQVALQDDGSARKYFVRDPGGAWRYVTSDGFPADPRGCAAVPQIPSALSALWNDCLNH